MTDLAYYVIGLATGAVYVLLWQEIAARRRLKRQLAAWRNAPVFESDLPDEDDEWESE